MATLKALRESQRKLDELAAVVRDSVKPFSGWIKCSDRLPLDDAFVLCSGIGQGCRDVFIGYRDLRGSWLEHNNGDYIDGGYGDDYPANVTHWQPLPAPPTE